MTAYNLKVHTYLKVIINKILFNIEKYYLFKVEYKCIKRKQKGKTVDNAIKFSKIKTNPKLK